MPNRMRNAETMISLTSCFPADVCLPLALPLKTKGEWVAYYVVEQGVIVYQNTAVQLAVTHANKCDCLWGKG